MGGWFDQKGELLGESGVAEVGESRCVGVLFAEGCGKAFSMVGVGVVGSGETVEVSCCCGLESEVTVGELGEVGWGCRNRGRHVGCGLGKG